MIIKSIEKPKTEIRYTNSTYLYVKLTLINRKSEVFHLHVKQLGCNELGLYQYDVV